VIKLNAAVQTAADFEELGALFGFDICVSSGVQFADFPLEFPIFFIDDTVNPQFTIVVELTDEITGGFDFAFPFTFGNGDIELMECFFNKLKPANVQILLKQC
jgi:hypothetical protein